MRIKKGLKIISADKPLDFSESLTGPNVNFSDLPFDTIISAIIVQLITKHKQPSCSRKQIS